MVLGLLYTWMTSFFHVVNQLIREQPTEPLVIRAAPSLIRELDLASEQSGANRSRLVRMFIEHGLSNFLKECN